MNTTSSFFSELKRRNVLRAGALYVAGGWALAQGIAQLAPSIGASDWVTRWFLVAAVVGFPFWLALAWFYQLTPQGLKRAAESDADNADTRRTSRKLDIWIIGVLSVAVVLLLTDRFVRKDAAQVATVISARSIAVLPLTNDSGDQDQQYFSDGLSEDLITALSQFAGLKVISRNSSFQFRGSSEDSRTIGSKLGVAHLLEGSVRRIAGQVRITAQLVNAADGSALWSQRYDRPYKDLFKLQDDITKAVANELQAKLLPEDGAVVQNERPPSGNLEAFNAYLQGGAFGQLGTEDGYHKAIDAYGKGISLDSHYAAAYARLSGVWQGYGNQLLGGEKLKHARAKGRMAAVTALSLDPNLSEAHRVQGDVLLTTEFNWTGAEAEYRRALQLAPNNGGAKYQMAILQATLGHPEQAVKLLREIIEADPLQGESYSYMAIYLASLGRLDQAEQAILKAIELRPGRASNFETLTIIKILRGDTHAALTAAHQGPPGPWQDFALALAQQNGSDHAAADASLQTVIDKYPDGAAYQIAQIYALRKNPDKVFEWLDHAWAVHDAGVTYLLTDPFIRHYKNDPRFAAFCKKLGLPLPDGTPISAKSAATEAET